MIQAKNIYFFVHLGHHIYHRKKQQERITRQTAGSDKRLTFSRSEKAFLQNQFSVYGRQIQELAKDKNSVAVIIDSPLYLKELNEPWARYFASLN